MEKRKEKRRSLRSILLLLLLSAIILLSSSYAWFTSNQTVAVKELEVNVTTSSGLQISADGNVWSALLDKNALTAAATTYSTTLRNQLPTALAPVSTIGAVDTSTGLMNMYLGSTSANTEGKYVLTAEKEVEGAGMTTAGHYLAFDMFLKVESTTQVYLGVGSGVTPKTGNVKGLENAARIAFIVQGYQPAGTDLTTIQNQKGGTSSIIWEPNYDAHTPAAIAHAIGTYGATLANFGQTIMPERDITCDRIAYDGIKADITSDNAVEVGKANATNAATYFSTVSPTIATTKAWTGSADGQAQSLFTLQAGITKVRVYCWVEGQDYDCGDNASGQDIVFNLQITKEAPTT